MKNSHHQFLNRAITLLMLILIVSLPVKAEELIKTEVDIPSGEDIIKGGEFAQFALIAKSYEPQILRSSLIEQNNVPIYIHLAAIPTDPTLAFPRIQPPLIVTEIENKSYLAGGIRYHEPKIYSWDDIGYLETRLKKIPKEEDVPENIKTTVKVKINYEAESVPGQLTVGTESKELEFKKGITRSEILESEEYSFFGGKGYVTIENAGKDSASYKIYNEYGELIGSVSSTKNRPSSEVRLIKTSSDLRDRIRIRTEEVKDFSQSYAKLNIDNEEKILNFNSRIKGWFVKGVYLANKKNPINYLVLYKPRIGTVYLSDENIYTLKKMQEIAPKMENKAFLEMEKRYNILKTDFGDFQVIEFNKGEQTKAVLQIDGSTMQLKQGEQILGTECSVLGISYNSIRIKHPIEQMTRTGKITKESSTVLMLERFEESKYQTYRPETAPPATSNLLPANICGKQITLKDIDFKKTVKFTIMSGRIRGSSETTLTINIPIEKKPWNPSPKTIDKLINKTEKQIIYLDEKIERLDKAVTKWRKYCLATAAVFTVWSFISGFEPESKKQERLAETKRKNEPAKTADGVYINFSDMPETKTEGCGKGYKSIDYYSEPTPTKDNQIYIVGNNYARYYVQKPIIGPKTIEKGKVAEIGGYKCDITYNSVIYDKKGTAFIYDRIEHQFKEYTGMDKNQFGTIRTISTDQGTAVIIPIKDRTHLPTTAQKAYSSWEKAHGFGKHAGLYAVYKDNLVEFWAANGKPDAGNKLDDDTKDKFITYYSKNSIEYKQFTSTYINRIRNAQKRGYSTLDIGSDRFSISPDVEEISSARLPCTEVMPSWQCTVLYNACDPVMCPTSRCNLDGTYKVQSVIKSGLIGSIVLCLPNIKQGVLMPVCLTGILASLKNIRSYLDQYKKCLVIKKTEGKSVGICEKIRSIYMCEIIWKQVMPILLKLGKSIFSSGAGSEYIGGVNSGLDSASRTFTFFTRDYAKEIFAAYQAKTTEEIGLEFCKAAVGGSLPNFGKLVDEMATPEDPFQYTAWLEEHDYSTTKSSYQIYYHIYAGKPKRKETINYQIALRGKNQPPINIAQGILKSEDSVDETKEIIQNKGYNEICVTVDGEIKCGFGKVVSTSYGLQQLLDNALGLSTEAKVSRTKDCVSGVAPTDIGIGKVQIPQIPAPSIIRKCSPNNPYLGLPKKEAEWKNIGECIDDDGAHSGICWAKLDTKNYPEIEEASGLSVCKGTDLDLCETTQQCKGGTVIEIFYNRECCEGGDCKDIMIGTTTLSKINLINEINEVFKEHQDKIPDMKAYITAADNNYGKPLIGDSVLLGSIQKIREDTRKDVGTKSEFYYIMGLLYLKHAKFAEAENAFNKVTKEGIKIKALERLKDYYESKKDWTKLKEVCKKLEDTGCINKAEAIVAEQRIIGRIKAINTCDKAITEYNNIINSLKGKISISDETNALALLEVIKTCLKNKKYDEAEEQFIFIDEDNLKENQRTEFHYLYVLSQFGADSYVKKSDLEYELNQAPTPSDINWRQKIQNLKTFLNIPKDYNQEKNILEAYKKSYENLEKKAYIDEFLKYFITKEIEKINKALSGTTTQTSTTPISQLEQEKDSKKGEKCNEPYTPPYCEGDLVCHETKRVCVECETNNDCKTIDKPVCDEINNCVDELDFIFDE